MTRATFVDHTAVLEELHVGELLAEGGEGRVFELPRQPHLVLKRYRQPAPRAFLDDLVAWPRMIGDPAIAGRVQAATAWPAATVVSAAGPAPAHEGDANGSAGAPAGAPGGAASAGPPGGACAGVLLPRAPRRFALRHRDGSTRLASLSYLTADPNHRAVAYGLSLPDPVSPERLGLVYALARLLEAFESVSSPVGHGDLSTKNVLWSLQRGPEIFVLDCDNCEHYKPDGRPLTANGRRRAMTPNWEDPAVPPGGNPTLESDRYSLALIFLRVVGAANFPIQARQRQGEAVAVDFAVPRGRFGEAVLGPGAPLWDLCERGLSVSDPSGRPGPSEWAGALEGVLDKLGAAGVMRAVWAAQGGGGPAIAGGRSSVIGSDGPNRASLEPSPAGTKPSAGAGKVVIRPVVASPRPAPSRTVVPANAPVPPWRRAQGAAVLAGPSAGVAAPAPVPVAAGGWGSGPGGHGGRAPASTGSVGAQGWAFLVLAVSWWLAFHRQGVLSLWTPGRRADGVRHLALCAAMDIVAALVGLFVVAMIVSPVLGI
jgi:hypothetical protein